MQDTWAAIERVAAGLGVSAEAIRKWRVRGVPRAWRFDLIRSDIRREIDEVDFDRPPGPHRPQGPRQPREMALE